MNYEEAHLICTDVGSLCILHGGMSDQGAAIN